MNSCHGGCDPANCASSNPIQRENVQKLACLLAYFQWRSCINSHLYSGRRRTGPCQWDRFANTEVACDGGVSQSSGTALDNPPLRLVDDRTGYAPPLASAPSTQFGSVSAGQIVDRRRKRELGSASDRCKSNSAHTNCSPGGRGFELATPKFCIGTDLPELCLECRRGCQGNKR